MDADTTAAHEELSPGRPSTQAPPGPAGQQAGQSQQPPSPSAAPTRRRRGLGWLGWSLIVVAALLVLTVVAVLLLGSMQNSTPLHPRNPRSDGTMAMAEVLKDHGVRVRPVSTYRSLLQTEPDADDTVVITDTTALDPEVAREIATSLQRAGRVVVVAHEASRLAELGIPVAATADSAPAGQLTADCAGDLLPAGVRATELTDSFTPTAAGWTGCFATTDGHALTYGRYGRATAVVIGSTDFADNASVLTADNAQLSLWLYGSTERLIWYQPDPRDTIDTGSDDDSTTDSYDGIAPPWFMPVLVLLGFVVITLIIVRGRRFGRLAREPMPVVVSALETTRIRGRLYRGTGDLGHSVLLLRAAAVRRLARRVGLPADADPDQVAARLRTGHPRAPDLLTGPLPTTPDQAVQWLHELRRLEDEVADD